jgi:hypothetical protein
MKGSLVFVICICWFAISYAGDEAKVVIQVPESFYNHPIRLMNTRVNYWHDRGNAVETAGIAAFQAQHYKTSTCKTEAIGQALVMLVPNVSYNPQMGIFHTEIIAKIYSTPTAEGALHKPLLTLKGQGQSRGWLSSNSEKFIQLSYQQAFVKVIEQLNKDSTFQQALDKAPQKSYQALCDSIDALAQTKLYS